MDSDAATRPQGRNHSFDQIPEEMRAYRQWVVWKYEQQDANKRLTKGPYNPINNNHASVDNPDTWVAFREAVEAFEAHPGLWTGIGFVLTENDPYTFIDLDDTEGNEALLQRQREIFEKCPSYAELSPSGKGLHIICRASLPTGRKRDKVEVYSDRRYMTMTGNVFCDAPITDQQTFASMLWHSMAGPIASNDAAPHYQDATESDDAVYNTAAKASNGAKFLALWNGDALAVDGSDKSGSSVDQALVNILAFYSKDPRQVETLWLRSPQGQREKTQARAKYRHDTIARAFDRAVPPVNIDPILAELATIVDAAKNPTIDYADLPPMVDIRDFADKPPRPRGFVVEGLIPERTVTLWSGDGGVGKSLAATQTGFAIATGRRAFGSETRAGSCLFITAEDEQADLHWRVAMIAKHEGVSLRDVEPNRMGVWSFAGHDALLVVGNGRGGIVPTPLFATIRARIDTMRPTLVVLDTSADLFGGEENNRMHVRQFIGMLSATAIDFDTTIVLLSHPSLTGITNGSGLSGSTAWNNSVRARLYMKRDPNDPATTILSVMKSNYGPTGEQIRLEWRNGVFATLGRDKDANAHKVEQEGSVDDVFLALLSEFAENEKYVVRVANSPDYAPKLFSKNPKSRGYSKQQFVEAMVRLFAQHRIGDGMVGPYPSKQKKVIVPSPPSGSASGSISK